MLPLVPYSPPPTLTQILFEPDLSLFQPSITIATNDGTELSENSLISLENQSLIEDFLLLKDKINPINPILTQKKEEIKSNNSQVNSEIIVNQSLTTQLITQDRGGEVREFEFSSEEPAALEINGETSENNNGVIVPIPIEEVRVVEILADQQEYDELNQVITAIGNVEMRFAEAVLTADRVQVNLQTRLAVGEGRVGLRRGDQLFRGSRFEYFFVQDQGVVKNASGEIYQPSLARDLSTTTLPSQQLGSNLSPYPLSERLLAEQPLDKVRAQEGYQVTIGSGEDLGLVEGTAVSRSSGQINRYRFEAEEIEFNSEGWFGKNVRITNDPFSPPELEIRADTARYEQTEPLVSVLTTTNSRAVFDQSVSIPIFQDRLVFDRRPRDPGLFSIGIDSERGGIFIERTFHIVDTERFNFRVTPQYFIQKSLFPDFLSLGADDDDNGDIFRPSVFGLKLEADASVDQRTDFKGKAIFTSLDFNEIENETEANLRLNHRIGDINRPHNLSLEYNYRDRLFNGSLGFQRVQSSVGLLLRSPNIVLGDTGINLNYQGSIQNINSDTDRLDLLAENRDNNRANLTRYQVAASLIRGISLWSGETLPATPTEGLRFTPTPVVPYLRLNTGITGISSIYSNGDTQQSIRGNIGLSGQVGHFSEDFFDYTGFNINYSQAVIGDQSPFLFDRIADERVLSWGITQQIYGPLRFGFQTQLNLDTNKEISTDYILEYSRRTHNISVRYNPVLELGAITFRLSDFNWTGSADPFDGETVGEIRDGVKW